jgi:hypothetical protein
VLIGYDLGSPLRRCLHDELGKADASLLGGPTN